MPLVELLQQSNMPTSQPEPLCPRNVPPAHTLPHQDKDVLIDTEELGDVTSGANAVTVCIE